MHHTLCFRLFLSLFLLLPFQARSAVNEAIQLDQKEAKLNEQRTHVREVSTAHGEFKILRSKKIYGPKGSAVAIQKWYQDMAAWSQTWNDLLAMLTSTQLRDLDQAQAVSAGVRTQLDNLNVLDKTRLQILADLQQTSFKVIDLPKFSLSYVDNSAAIIRAYNENVERLRVDIHETYMNFDKASVERHQELCLKVIKLVESKSTALALSYPDLQKTIAEIKFSIENFRDLEKHRNDFLDQVKTVQTLYMDDKLYLTALKDSKALETLAKELTDKVNAQTQFAESARLRVTREIAFSLSNVKAEFEVREQDDPARSRFIRKYKNEVFGDGIDDGLAARCAQLDKTLDCSIMRQILFYPASNLETLDDDQLQFIEAQLEKVKKGYSL